MIRAFIAIDVANSLKKTISQLQTQLKFNNGRVAWVRPEVIHLTLQFLGDIEKPVISNLNIAIEQALENKRRFKIVTDTLGIFPNKERPRVLWLGINGGDELLELQQAIVMETSSIGFIPDKQVYHPHLTIGRVKSIQRNSDLANKFTELRIESFSWQCEEVRLMSSKLLPRGAVHSVISTFRLID